MILSSKYIIGKSGEINEDVDYWKESNLPIMEGNNLITVDISGSSSAKRKVSVPKEGHIAELKKDKTVPKCVKENVLIKEKGFGITVNRKLKNKKPFEFYIQSTQEAALGHAMIFSNFVKIMDWAEIKLLTQELKPGLQYDLLSNLHTLERKIYYYSNCFSGETLDIYVKGNIEYCPENYHGKSLRDISVFLMELEMEIYQKNKNILLSVGRVKKLFNMPITQQYSLPNIKRIINELNN